MKIRTRAESHLVELEDGSRWQIFPGDIHMTLGWQPLTDLTLVEIEDDLCSHALVNADDGSHVRIIAFGRPWPAAKLRNTMKDG